MREPGRHSPRLEWPDVVASDPDVVVVFPCGFSLERTAVVGPGVVNDDLRYTDWRRRNGSVPAYLDETDVGALLGSDALFARKVSSDISGELLDAIDDERFDSGRERWRA